MGIIYLAITILGMTAIAGMYLLSLILRDKGTPKGVTIIHGIFAALALVLLIIFSVNNNPRPMISIIVFTIAAVSGAMLNYRDLTGKKVPKWFAVAHGLVAVIGFAFLIVFASCPSCLS